MKRKLNEYKVWTHMDSGIAQTVLASTKEEALVMAKNNIIADDIQEKKDCDEQLIANAQTGETDIVD